MLPPNSNPTQPIRLQDAKLQISILRALDTWLAEDHNRVEQRLTQRDAAHYLVECFKRTVHPRDEALLPQVGATGVMAVCSVGVIT